MRAAAVINHFVWESLYQLVVNSTGPDQMLKKAAFDKDLHCLQKGSTILFFYLFFFFVACVLNCPGTI